MASHSLSELFDVIVKDKAMEITPNILQLRLFVSMVSLIFVAHICYFNII